MDYVAQTIKHNVLVVSVLDLQHITHQAVPSERLKEAGLGSFKRTALPWTMLAVKVVQKCWMSAMNFVKTHCVVQKFYQPAVRSSSKYLVRLQPQLKIFHSENLLDLAN